MGIDALSRKPMKSGGGGITLVDWCFKVRFARTYVEGLLRAYITHLYEMWAGRILKS